MKLVASLNPRRYRLEHIQDVTEALMRAEFVLAHAVMVHVEELDAGLMKRLESTRDHGVSLVVVTSSDRTAQSVAKLGAYVLKSPFGVMDVKRRVLEAVSEAHLERARDAPPSSRSLAKANAKRVVVLVGAPDVSEIVAALFRGQLGVECEQVDDPKAAIALLERGYDCLVAKTNLLLGSPEGGSLSRKLARRGIPVVPVTTAEELDAETAGQLTWSLIPLVRRSLAARRSRSGRRPR